MRRKKKQHRLIVAAIALVVIIAAFFALRALARMSGVQRQRIPGPGLAGDERIALFRLDGALFFGAAERVVAGVSDIADVQVVILRMSQVQFLDATGAQVLTDLVTSLERRGITVLIKGIRPEHLRIATRVGVIASLRHDGHLVDHPRPMQRRGAHAHTRIVMPSASE